jgi:hypothetical protein
VVVFSHYSNTDLHEGLGYLPDKLKLVCLSDDKAGNRSKIIQNELTKHNNNLEE